MPALLDAGASPKVKNGVGLTPLHLVVRHLLQSMNRATAGGSDVSNRQGQRIRIVGGGSGPEQPTVANATELPLTPEQLKSIIKGLVAKGGDINAMDLNGEFPLGYAVSSLEVFDWLVSVGADPNAKTIKGTLLISAINDRESRIALEARYVYPKTAPKDGVLINTLFGEPIVMRPTAEFEQVPTFAEVLAEAFPAEGNISLDSKYDIAVYRLGTKGRFEEVAKITLLPFSSNAASEAAKWPKLVAGDVVIIPLSNTGRGNPGIPRPAFNNGTAVQSSDSFQQWLTPALPHPRITVEVGGHSQSVVFSKVTSRAWAPVTGLAPIRDLGSLAHYVQSGDPSVDFAAVKVVRTVDGAQREWTVDVRPAPGSNVRPRLRIADGDRVVFPLKHTPESIAKRRGKIWSAAPGRVFSEYQIAKAEKDQRPPQLGDLLWKGATGKFVNVGVDFSKLTIHRLKGDAGEEEHIVVNLDAPFARWKSGEADAAQKANVELQWGDVVEFATLPGAKPEELRDYAEGERGEFIRDMRKRTVIVEGPFSEMILTAGDLGKPGYREDSGWDPQGGPDEAFLLRTLVKRTIDGKRCRVVLKSGDRTRTISPDEVATFAEPLRDRDKVDITEL